MRAAEKSHRRFHSTSATRAGTRLAYVVSTVRHAQPPHTTLLSPRPSPDCASRYIDDAHFTSFSTYNREEPTRDTWKYDKARFLHKMFNSTSLRTRPFPSIDPSFSQDTPAPFAASSADLANVTSSPESVALQIRGTGTFEYVVAPTISPDPVVSRQ